MSTLKQKAQSILDEKDLKIIPNNIKDGIEIFDIIGSYQGELNAIKTTSPWDMTVLVSLSPDLMCPGNMGYYTPQEGSDDIIVECKGAPRFEYDAPNTRWTVSMNLQFSSVIQSQTGLYFILQDLEENDFAYAFGYVQPTSSTNDIVFLNQAVIYKISNHQKITQEEALQLGKFKYPGVTTTRP